MRITNGMMINNCLANININKLNIDKLSTQQATGKKIQKPSDDPIIAVRALRFRSQLEELNQYLKKNIPDAESWLEVTEDALRAASKMLQGIQTYLDQAANDTYNVENRKDIVETLNKFKDQIFQDANADYAGRRVFSGFKTDTNMTFSKDTKQRYDIKENITADDIDTISKVKNPVEIGAAPNTIPETDQPNIHEVYRIRLSYEELSYQHDIKLKDETGADVTSINIIKVVADADGVYRKVKPDGTLDTTPAGVVNDIYSPDETNKEAYMLVDTGELVLSDTAYTELKGDMGDKTFSISYTKESFNKNDLRPEQYFDCVSYNADGTTTQNTYTNSEQAIQYTVNFNQKIKINTEGKNVFTHGIVRDIDELLNNVEAAQRAQDKVDKIKNMMKEDRYSSETEQEKLNSMLKAAEKELVLADDIMQKSFESNITNFQNYQDITDAEVADVGSRGKRLELNKERLTSQQTVYEELKSINEDIDVPETIIRLTSASMLYESALSAINKILSKSLLDYL